MRKYLYLILLVLLPDASLMAQHQVNSRPYQVWIDKTTGTTVAGTLAGVGEDQLQLLPSFYYGKQGPAQLHQLSIPSADIQQVKFRRKGKVGRGILIGVAAGVITGVIIGVAAGDDPDCGYDPNNPSPFGHVLGSLCESMHMTAGEKAVLAGTGLGLAGGLVGGIIGSIKVKIPINGSKDSFKANRFRLEHYVVGD